MSKDPKSRPEDAQGSVEQEISRRRFLMRMRSVGAGIVVAGVGGATLASAPGCVGYDDYGDYGD
ncbi:MAG: hypothetical protein RBU30_06600 [Polyangia bacterium]|jgi:hypothetical protein|nr:hypothetical protein [Polyangia bacterium]